MTLTGSIFNVDNVESISWVKPRINYTHIITTVKTCKWKFIEKLENILRTKKFAKFTSHGHVKDVFF